MIEYSRGPFGLSLLFRWNGSALIKAFIPGLFSVSLYLTLYYSLLDYAKEYYHTLFAEDATSPEAVEDKEKTLVDYLNHPYAIGVLIASTSLLITFRANYGYQRYWEGASAVHSMMSKFMDATVHAGVFHLQSEKFKPMRPPTFFEWEELNGGTLTRDRERVDERVDRLWSKADSSGDDPDSFREDAVRSRPRPQSCQIGHSASLRRRRFRKSINQTASTRTIRTEEPGSYDNYFSDLGSNHLLGPPRLDGGWGLIHPDERTGRPTATHYDIAKFPNASQIDPNNLEGFASTRGGRTPSLFLQELAHLSSLLCAVAMTTLRNDLDDVESPLGTYVPGQPWPECDPMKLPKEVKRAAYGKRRNMRNLHYLLGMDQTKSARTAYNAARPLLVLGGVSDNEIAFLQRARGPYAKTQLCWAWISEFVIREQLAGSMGNVGPPIVSRIIQFLSDGMKYYNDARKIMWVPFPFPHAQLCAFFIFVVAVCIPFLMNQYANQVWLGSTLTFLVVTCLAGLHEVARELENPFRNAPNDIPLCTMMAFYNEALITMFAGFHPDSYWDEADVLKPVVAVEENGSAVGMDDFFPSVSEDNHASQTMSYDDEKKDDVISNSAPLTLSIDDESLMALREMIELQAVKIKELQDRMRSKEQHSSYSIEVST
ncbi:hypothetical protein HJC23_001964 [Cyclotella cryptica]|uniref:Bestrophin homolog n=1 Tax=Cyclotella cryptica TaxID=29204 RepID=A0ABD3PP39_9STRA|eukprot:CCRYP_012931-RA/>CCRYP_012931-RA protein AED:0.19 eAED:0.19 QI:0/-1/0/1/-1/1/1/0/655